MGQATFEGGNAEDVIDGEAQYVKNGQENLGNKYNSTYITDENFYKIPVGRSNGAPSNTEVHYTYIRTMTVFTGDHRTPEYKGYNVIYASNKEGTKYVPIAISDDGGRTYLGADDNPKFPLNSKAVDFTAIINSKDQVNGYDDLLSDLNDRDSNFAKGVKTQINEQSFQDGSDRSNDSLMKNKLGDLPRSQKNKIFGTQQPVYDESITENIPEGGDPEALDRNFPVSDLLSSERFAFSQVSYPEDLDLSSQDALEIRVMDRKPVRFTGGLQSDRTERVGLDEQGKEKTLTTIYLPIQSNIRENNSVDYDRNQLNFLQGAAIGAIKKIFESDAEGKPTGEGRNIGGFVSDLRGQFGNNQQQIKQLVGDATASAALGSFVNQSINTLSSRFNGQILNPNLELLFKGPTLRDFTLIFLMSPRSDTEARNVRRIINTLKRSMSPKKGKEGSFFLGSPDFFKLRYLHKNSPHNSLHKFKDCILKDMRMDYTPQGTYATYTDGSMHSYQMTLTFGELDPVFDEDYDTRGDDNPGGVNEIGF